MNLQARPKKQDANGIPKSCETNIEKMLRYGEMICFFKHAHFVITDIPSAGISCSGHEEYSRTKSGRRDTGLNQQSDPQMSFFHWLMNSGLPPIENQPVDKKNEASLQ